MIKCLRARRGSVHRKQNCFRGVLLFKTHFAEFCVKSVCKTEPWNWAVRVETDSKYVTTLLHLTLNLLLALLDKTHFICILFLKIVYFELVNILV